MDIYWDLLKELKNENEILSNEYESSWDLLSAILRQKSKGRSCFSFSAKNGISTKGCNLYTTLSPCIQCSKMIINSGISRVFYKEKYRDTSGIDLLEKAGIEVVELKD